MKHSWEGSILHGYVACNCHLSVEWCSVEFLVRDNPKQWADGHNRKVLNLLSIGDKSEDLKLDEGRAFLA